MFPALWASIIGAGVTDAKLYVLLAAQQLGNVPPEDHTIITEVVITAWSKRFRIIGGLMIWASMEVWQLVEQRPTALAHRQ